MYTPFYIGFNLQYKYLFQFYDVRSYDLYKENSLNVEDRLTST